MITQEITPQMIEEYKAIWMYYKDKLLPNRKTGRELLGYLQENYTLTELHDSCSLDMIVYNVTMNLPFVEKLPEGKAPIPKAFYLENLDKGKKIYQVENSDPVEFWGEDFTKIFIGIDIETGYYMVEGSTMLWDELCAFLGLDEKDLQNFVCVAEYINCLKRFDKIDFIQFK